MLDTQRDNLVNLAKKSLIPSGGYGWLNNNATQKFGMPLMSWINFRMTYIFALEKIRGSQQVERYLDHGILAIRSIFKDGIYGGYFAEIYANGDVNDRKKSYEFAFVLLALSTAVRAGNLQARDELESAIEIFEKYFWDESHGLVRESWNREFTDTEDYRGLNANMHTFEALLSLYETTGDAKWQDRAYRVCKFAFGQRQFTSIRQIPEHFDKDWQLDTSYNIDYPHDPFRPYGAVIGHQFEWARLALALSATYGDSAPQWIVSEAMSTYLRAKEIGWAINGIDGFLYTVDFQAQPVVDLRMHWVITEAISASWKFYELTGSFEFFNDFKKWSLYARKYFIDPTNGSWRHELDNENNESSTIWQGRPDIYHAYNAATVVPEESCAEHHHGLNRKRCI